jgi:hypothetical protein
MLRGQCFCGAVRYEVAGSPRFETNCHCTNCRRTSGAPFVAWFTVFTADLRFTSGTPTSFKSSDHGSRTFCSRCGTPLTFQSTHSPTQIDITTCSLERPEDVPPRDHTYVRSKVGWVHLDDGLPEFPERRL